MRVIIIDLMECVKHENDKRTCPITFRLPEGLVNELRKEAQDKKVSLNTLTNQLLHRYITWEKHSGKIGLIPITRPFLSELVKDLSSEEIKQLACNGSKDTLKELVLLSNGAFTLDALISVFNEWLKASWMTYRYEYDNMVHHYVIHHGLGTKWSLYLAELLTAICMETMKTKPEIEIRNDSITFAVSSGIIDSEQLELISEKQTQ